MTDRPTLSFDGEELETGTPCFLRITFLNRPYANASESWDSDLINCEVTMKVDAFKARYSTAIWGHELVFIRAVLSALYERVGEEAEGLVDLLDNAFKMRLAFTRLGQLVIDIVAYGELGREPYLRFTMKADQSYLPLWIKQLDTVLSRFPAEVQIDVRNPLSYQDRHSASIFDA